MSWLDLYHGTASQFRIMSRTVVIGHQAVIRTTFEKNGRNILTLWFIYALPSIVQIMPYHLFDAISLAKAVLAYCQLFSWDWNNILKKCWFKNVLWTMVDIVSAFVSLSQCVYVRKPHTEKPTKWPHQHSSWVNGVWDSFTRLMGSYRATLRYVKWYSTIGINMYPLCWKVDNQGLHQITWINFIPSTAKWLYAS